MITRAEIQTLKRIFNDRTDIPSRHLYLALEKFMKTEKLYSKQRLKEWIEQKLMQQDQEQYGESDARERLKNEQEMQTHRENCQAAIAARRKLQTEVPTQESLDREIDLNLQIRIFEDNILILRKKLDNNELWLDRKLLKSSNNASDRPAVHQLTDFKIIERWGAGGRNRTWLDQYCADGIELWDEHFSFDGDGPNRKKLSVNKAIESKVSLPLQLTYCLISIIYELMSFIRTSEWIIQFLNGEESLSSEALFPLKPVKKETDCSEDENDQLNDVIPSDAVVERLSSQIGNANLTLISLEEKIPLLLLCLTKIKNDKFVDLNQTHRDIFTSTIDKIMGFLTWSQESRASLAKIITRLTKLFSTEFLDPRNHSGSRTFAGRARAPNPSPLRNASSRTPSGPYGGQTFRSPRSSDDPDPPKVDSIGRRHSVSGAPTPLSITPPLSNPNY